MSERTSKMICITSSSFVYRYERLFTTSTSFSSRFVHFISEVLRLVDCMPSNLHFVCDRSIQCCSRKVLYLSIYIRSFLLQVINGTCSVSLLTFVAQYCRTKQDFYETLEVASAVLFFFQNLCSCVMAAARIRECDIVIIAIATL